MSLSGLVGEGGFILELFSRMSFLSYSRDMLRGGFFFFFFKNSFKSVSNKHSDVLHPNRANVSKDELREKLSGLYSTTKDQVSVFGFRTQFGGGKSTGFALVYDSSEALKRFEPHYRLVRIGAADKIEKASRQQRMFPLGWVV